MSFKKFRRTAIAEMREVESVEIDWFKERGEMRFYLDSDKENRVPYLISISEEDLKAGSPRLGDMIARNPDNERDQWLVAKAYFEKNFAPDFVLEVGKPDGRNLTKEDIEKITLNENGSIQGVYWKSTDLLNVVNNEISSDKDFHGLLRVGKGTFGMAIEAAKQGKKVARAGWNGQSIFAYIVPGGEYTSQTEIAVKTFGSTVPYRAYWALKTAQNDVATWAPSGSDSLAEDWMIIE